MVALTRRQFSAGLGGVVVAFSLSPRLALAQAERLPGRLQTNRMLDAWIRINADGSATVCTGKVELGQGIITALAQMAAEELDLPLAKGVMISGDTGRPPDEGVTSGSNSLEQSGTALRFACAEARAIVIEIAAKRFGAEARTLTVADGVVSAPGGRTVSYGQLAAELDLKREATGKVAPKASAAHKIVGTAARRLDIPAKVTGGEAFIQDIRLAGMVHGRVVRPPRDGAKSASVKKREARALPGVIMVVRDGSFLGVVAEREEQAIRARFVLMTSARWSGGSALPETKNFYEHLLSLAAQVSVISEKKAAIPDGARRLEATYRRPYVAHGAIGPSCALAELKDGKLTVWTHSQGVFPLRRDLSKVMKMEQASIRCIFAEGAGCYGRSGADDAPLDAALLARALPGRPVRVQWMRDDEFGWEPFGPAMVMQVKAALGADGRIADWQYEEWSGPHGTRPGEKEGTNLFASWELAEPQPRSPSRNVPLPAGGSHRNAIPLYEFPSQRVIDHFVPVMPIWVSSLRTLGGYANVFAIESFMDEAALAGGVDPNAFLLAHVKDPRAREVIETAVRKAGCKEGDKGAGRRGRGFGFAKDKNLANYCACVAEIEVDPMSGKVRVPRVVSAVDAGLIINPDGLVNQIEGGIVQSVSWTLYEEVRFEQNRVASRDWAQYPILTMPNAPQVEVELINRPGEKPMGAGEAASGPAAAAVAHPIAHATGKRLRDLPLTPTRVKAALG